MRFAVLLAFCASSLHAAAEDIRQIKDMYLASFAAIKDVKTRADIERLIDNFETPEWVGNMPAGETLTRADAVAEGVSILSIPAEKRPSFKMQYVYVTETGWNVLFVYWRYREMNNRNTGALFRDTWVRTAHGWRRTRTEKFFPDLTLVGDGNTPFLPGPEIH